MKTKTCCFTGHRYIPRQKIPEIKEHLKNEIVKLIHQNVIYFGVGGALGFDTISAITVLQLKERYQHIKLISVLPCKEQTHGWNIDDIKIYKQILVQADKVVYTSEHYFDGCMHKRNKHLVDHSDYCICYLTKNSGGTKYTVDYAIRKGLNIIML